MAEALSEYGPQIAIYSTEIAVNCVILFLVLNRLVPPSHDIMIGEEALDSKAETMMRIRRAYPLWRCLALSVCLFFVFIAAASCLTLPRPANYPGFIVPYSLLALTVSYFGSTIVIGTLFRMPRGQVVIFILYVASSLVVENLLARIFDF